jgi:PAS domain S-box-containing protein
MNTISLDTQHLSVDPEIASKWQQVLDLLAQMITIPAALIMRVEPPKIKVFLSSHTHGNPYEEHELAPLGTGLYCETVMATRSHLIVPNALTDKNWCTNPDVKLGMISYMGLPLVWPDRHVFGTICVLDRQENAYNEMFLELLQQFRGIVERDLKHIYEINVRAAEDAAIRADEAERVRKEFMVIRAGEQKALLALQESEQRWHFALEGAGDGVWDWNIQHDTIFYSQRCLELLGFPSDSTTFVFADWERCVHPDDLHHVKATITDYLSGKITSFKTEHRFRKGEDWVWLLGRGMVVERDKDGNPVRMIGTYSDITERKRIEGELLALNTQLEERIARRTAQLQKAMDQMMVTEKMASLGRMVAGIAHEMNTPIGNMLLSSSTLMNCIEELDTHVKDKKLTKHALDDFLLNSKQACELIERNSERAQALIASLKQASADQTHQQRCQFDLRNTVVDMLVTWRPMLNSAHVTLELAIPEGIVMNSYPGSIEQLLGNLISNSIKHGFENKNDGCIHIHAATSDTSVDMIYEDNGIGIDAALQNKVFDPFYTTKIGQGCAGLGLAIVHNIVQSVFKGSITLESQPGQGVRFMISLPRLPDLN